LGIHWRTTLGFYENRFAVLRAFDDQGLLRQLRVAEQRVSVRLKDPYHVLVFTPENVEVSVLRPDGDLGLLASALGRVWEALTPSRVANPEMRFQWLVPLEGDYDQARANGVERLFGRTVSGVTMKDWSATLAAETEGRASTAFLEFGVVDSDEAPQRLARQIGAFQGQGGPETPPSIWEPSTLPPVAFFVDLRWSVNEGVAESPEGVIRVWEETRKKADGLVSDLMKRIYGDTSG
jgi:hypothetical protein